MFQNAAILKRNVWKWIASGNSATNAKEFAAALVGHSPVANVLVMYGKIINKPKKPKKKATDSQITPITKFKDIITSMT